MLSKLRQFIIAEAKKWSVDEFIKVWNAAQNRDEVATYFGISPQIASIRAKDLRTAGHDLKKFPRGRSLGTTVTPREKKTFTPEEFIEVWNSSNTINDAAITLGVSYPDAMRLAKQLIVQGYDLKTHTPGRKVKYDIDLETFSKIWNESDDVDDVLSRLSDMGIELDPERARNIVATWAFRARKQYDLKKMPHAQFVRVKPANIPSVPDSIEMPPEAHVEDPWDEDTNPDEFPEPFLSTDDGQGHETEQAVVDTDKEFEDAWNSSETFKDALKNLRRRGWSLPKDEIKRYAKMLRDKGVELKRFN
jgi:hypothetical protein